ncbi:hypothetical protein [Myroides sp. WP-1]|uniref:hypothetical protein n=1 Tax=Myroides sp. WP-1 TaxID=2759944 RepID=UPI0015FA6321|nr:hypothetical protein [Myroides sp. WP-1]MBB1140725.1 hypothetical protein [Myroides sp. WP-1]
MINIKRHLTQDIIDEHFSNIYLNNINLETGKSKKIMPNYLDELLDLDLNDRQRTAIEFLKLNVCNQENSILIRDVNALSEFKKEYEESFKTVLDTEIVYKQNKSMTLRRYLLDKVFYYADYDRWDAYGLAKKLNVNVCPYCNQLPTYTIGTSLKKGVRPEFDHFFDKARFPYLALSIYNLVPSCHICNSNLKGSTKLNLDDHYHPYLKGFDEQGIKFTLGIEKVEMLLTSIYQKKAVFKEKDTYKIEIVGSENINIFRLEDRYNYDISYIDEIIKKAFIYNDSYVESLYKEWDELFSSKEEIKQTLMGNYLNSQDIGKRPLGKLTRDITEELNIFSKKTFL